MFAAVLDASSMRVRRIVTAVALALVALAGALALHVTAILPLGRHTVRLHDVEPHEGFAYTASIPKPTTGRFEPDVVLMEDGAPMSWTHLSGPHGVASAGGGRFYVQHGRIYFSTTDNSDPRSNSRAYAVSVPWTIPAALVIVLWAAGALGAGLLMWFRRRELARLLTSPPFWLPALVLLVGVTLNRAWFFLDFPIVAIHPDSASYFAVAELIGGSHWPNFGNRPPVYPLFLRTVFALWDRALAVAVAQTALAGGAALLMTYACYRWHRATAIPAAAMLALSLFGFTTLEHDTAILSESLYSSLLVIAFAALMLGLRLRDWRWLLMSSASMALTILTRPAGLFLVVIYAVVVVWIFWRRFPRLATAAFLIPLPALLIAMSVYNMRVVRVFAPTTWGEANLAVATFLAWQPDPSYPPEINSDIERIRELLRARLASKGKGTGPIESSWDPRQLSPVFLEGFDQPALNIATRMGGQYETTARAWIRRIAFDAIRKNPELYAKFVFTMLYLYFAPIAEYDFRLYLQNRAALFYVTRAFAPERGNDFLVRLGKEFSTGQPPPAVFIREADASNTMAPGERVVLRPTRAWRVYELTHRVRRLVMQRSIWSAAIPLGAAASLLVLVRTRFRHEPAFVVFIVTIGAIGAALVVSLVEYSQPRYSYPMEWTYGITAVLLPLLLRRRDPAPVHGDTPLSPRVGLLLVTVGDLSGSGGTERQFTDLFEYFRRSGSVGVDLITSSAGVERLRQIGRLSSLEQVIALPLGPRPAHTRAGVLKLTAILLRLTLRHRWDVVHICQPTPVYVPYAALLQLLPRAVRPRLAMTVVDCTLAHHLRSAAAPSDLYEQQVVAAHRLYFRWAALDGVYSWYRAFVDAARALQLLPGAELAAASYCFADTTRFTPKAKQPLVVFAGRLSTQKRPLLFVDAVASLLRRYPDLADGWEFAMYGGGPLEDAVRARIRELGLEHRIALTRTPDMAPIFGRSKLFVSTQALENFTSLAMLEAMAAGNAVVAENAGQTGEFVRDRENGLLVTEPTPDAFADQIAAYLRQPDRHAAMAEASYRLATEVHTVRNFADDVTGFWQKLLRVND